MPPKSSHVEGVVPSAPVFKDEAFERLLDQEVIAFIDTLIHLWIHHLVGYWEVVKTVGCGP
jgi:hypothetical protein